MLKLLQRLTGSENPAPESVAAKLEAQHHHGLINFGNTCYCNSVIQVKIGEGIFSMDKIF
jgi:ubiquitin C-terminal hydrolase